MNQRSKPQQAVILCGGLGTRLRPLTNDLPKPMAPVNGEPFLLHLMRQLAEQGVARFVLLTGYLSEKIEAYFGDGTTFGWEIAYSVGPIEWDTGRRIWEARAQYDSQFLLMYSDNFVQFNLDKLQELHQAQNTPISLLLAPKAKGNIRISQQGLIQAYDNARNGVQFDYVEIGYMLIDRDRMLAELAMQPDFPNVSFSVLLKALAAEQKISGLVVEDSYHSISDIDRLALMSEYLRPKNILLIDRDGTINEKAPPGEYITHWESFRFIASTRAAMAELARHGFDFIVITNQAGVARKLIEPENLEDIHSKMTLELAKDGINILKIYVSPHHWDEKSPMRKPEPGMFFQAARDFKLRMDRCLYVGDDERDCEAARNAGCGMVFLSNDVSLAGSAGHAQPFFQSQTLCDQVDSIRQCYSNWDEQS